MLKFSVIAGLDPAIHAMITAAALPVKRQGSHGQAMG